MVEQAPVKKFDASVFVNLALSPIPSTFGRLVLMSELLDHPTDELAEVLYGTEQIAAANRNGSSSPDTYEPSFSSSTRDFRGESWLLTRTRKDHRSPTGRTGPIRADGMSRQMTSSTTFDGNCI